MGGVAQLGERLNGIQEVRGSIPLASIPCAGIAQLVEHNLAKVGVAGSSPVSRSLLETTNGEHIAPRLCLAPLCAGMAKLADARDLKSLDRKVIRVRAPVPALSERWTVDRGPLTARISRYAVAGSAVCASRSAVCATSGQSTPSHERSRHL